MAGTSQWLWTACLLSAQLIAAQSGSVTTVTQTIYDSQTISSTATSSACAQISRIQASFASASPSASSGPDFPATLAYDCSNSAPIVQEDALALIDGIIAYLQFQSTLEYLESPPEGYLLPGVNLMKQMNRIRTQIQSGGYKGEIEFETDLVHTLASTHDGHLVFIPDGLDVFQYQSQFPTVVSVSLDGKALPKIYFLSDIQELVDTAVQPSAVVRINGQAASQFAQTYTIDNATIGGSQDPDTLYNSFFFGWNAGVKLAPNPGAFTSALLRYLGPSTSVTFENGTQVTLKNFASTSLNFTGIVDGDTYYQNFINATVKSASLASATTTPTSSPPNPTRIPGFPIPEVISDDGFLSGYILPDTAVLVIRSFEALAGSFQDSLTAFLDICRQQNQTNLVIDLQGNGGGTIGLAYDAFKQFFPTIEPYGASNVRVHEGYRALGQTLTNITTPLERSNYTEFALSGGTSVFAAETFLDVNNKPITSFEELYGPVQAQGQFTNLFRLDVANQEFDEAFIGIVVSGYANESNLAPQPFEPENVVMLTDGACGSTCSIFSHFMKWQGKVRSVAIGGRPQTGPMQSVGAVKGSQVLLFAAMAQFLDVAQVPELADLYGLAEYLMLRTASGGLTPAEFSINIKNNIAERDQSRTPLQFVYEAADCRIWWQPGHVTNVTNLWEFVAAQAFGLEQWAMCVEGSTNQPSSLSGNPALYNNGVPTNVTVTEQKSNGTTYQGSGKKIEVGWVGMFITVIVLVVIQLGGNV